LNGHTSKVYALVLDTDMHLIFSGSMDGFIRVWDWDTGACLRILRGHLTLVGLLGLDHSALVSAGADQTLRIWDHPMRGGAASTLSDSQMVMRQRPFSNIAGDLVPAAVSPAASSALNAFPHLHNLEHGGGVALADLLRTDRAVLRGHSTAITCFQHDGTKIVSGADNTVKLWD
ncbi:SCF ubiquitin ligase complex subunit cdc4, partial [Coemansia sp. RSA 2424]